jgi:mannose-6-phosphate isomerase-like protein (cupin superfamily)
VSEPARRHAAGPGEAAASRRVDKPWGHELIWVATDHYVGKVIAITSGRRLSLQYHEQKDESIYVLRGRLRLHLEDAAGTMTVRELGPGDSARIPVGRRHRFEAVDDVELIEVSTPELDDVVRLEDDFGREGTSAP